VTLAAIRDADARARTHARAAVEARSEAPANFPAR